MNKDFLYSDLFKLLPQAFKVSKLEFNENGKTPAYSSDTKNNGCLGYVDRKPLYIVTKNCPVYLVFGDHTKTMNIVRRSFCVMDNVKVLIPKINMSDNVLLFITTVWKKSIPDLGYARHWSAAKIAKISLPVIKHLDPNHEYTIDDIDWQYMEERIKELEKERIKELEEERIKELDAYLKAANLDDYELTDEDKEILSLYRKSTLNENGSLEDDNGNITVRLKTFPIGSIFKRVFAKCKKDSFNKQKDTSTVPNHEFCVPLVNAKLGDNGIMFYGRKSEWDTQEMCIDIIQNGAVATGKVYAQPHPVAVLWDAYLVKPVQGVHSKATLLYLAKCIEKITKEKFSYDKKAVWERVKECKITLPVTPDGEPDFDYMERYIKAIKKLTIKDVVKYKDKVINTMKKIVNNPS